MNVFIAYISFLSLVVLVASTICGYQTKIKRGLKAEVEESIREAPKVTNNVSVAPDDDDDDDDEDDLRSHGPSSSGFNGIAVGSARVNVSMNASNGENAEEMEVDDTGGDTAEEDEGWTTVKKGGKKKR